MKNTTVIIKLSALLLALALFLIPLCSCGQDVIPLNIPSDNVSHKAKYIPYGHYIYFSFGWAYRADIREGTYSKACFDPECNGRCPLDWIDMEFCGEENGKIYFISQNHMDRKEYFAYQDASTGKVTCLAEYSENEVNGSMSSYIANGYWYYNVMLLKDGGDAMNPDDFVSTICRLSTETGKIETLFELDVKEYMKLAVDEKVITAMGTTLYAHDVATSETVPLYDIKSIGGTAFGGDISFYNGKYYFGVRTEEKAESEYRKSTVKLEYLYSLDAQSGECKKINEKPINSFCIANDGIFFVETEWRSIYLPDDWENHLDEVIETSMGTKLYCLDYQGEKSAVYESKDLSFPYDYIVLDGILYGKMIIPTIVTNEETGDIEVNTIQRFCTIDLSTGEVTYCDKEE